MCMLFFGYMEDIMEINFGDALVRDDGNCFVLVMNDVESYYKSFDLLLFAYVNKRVGICHAESVDELLVVMKDIRDLIHGLFSCSGMYPEIKSKYAQFVGVLDGRQC